MHTVGWYFPLVRCSQFPGRRVVKDVLVGSVPLSQAEQLRNSNGCMKPTCSNADQNPCPRLPAGAAAGAPAILSSSLAVGAVCTECTEPRPSKRIVLQPGVVIEPGENKGLCCTGTCCVLKDKHDLFPCVWKLIDHALEECPGVGSSESLSLSWAVLRKAQQLPSAPLGCAH